MIPRDGQLHRPSYGGPSWAAQHEGGRLTKTWEREFAIERMRENPDLSYRSIARVLGVRHPTVSRWAREAGLPPRETMAERSGRQERARASRKRWWQSTRPRGNESDEGFAEASEDLDEDESDEGLVEASEDLDEDLDEDETDEKISDDDQDDKDPKPTPYIVQAIEGYASWQTAKTAGMQPSPRKRARKTEPRPPRSTPAPVPRADPRTRLGAITADLDHRRPRGRVAVNLLVEAAPYMRGGVAALRSYGEARGCDPSDIDTAERMIAGRHAGRVS